MTGRIRPGMTSSAIIRMLAGDDANSLRALRASYGVLGESDCHGFFLAIDHKRLYGRRIGELFKVCGNDANRFIYHVTAELPNQQTGKWELASGPHDLMCDNESFKAARRNVVKPHSFWALKNPPVNPDYDYPIFQ